MQWIVIVEDEDATPREFGYFGPFRDENVARDLGDVLNALIRREGDELDNSDVHAWVCPLTRRGLARSFTRDRLGREGGGE